MDRIHALFKAIPVFETSSDLDGRIFRAIEAERRAFRRMFDVLFPLGFVGGVVSLVLAALWYGGSIVTSDFWSMSMVAFSDADVVLAHGSDFLFSLLETFPVMETVAFLVPVFVLMFLAEEYARRVSSYRRLTF